MKLLAWLLGFVGVATLSHPAWTQSKAGPAGDRTERGTGSVSLRNAPLPGITTPNVQVTLDAHESGRRTEGKAQLVGFPIVLDGTRGDVEWNIVGPSVTGALRGLDGNVTGKFEGTLTKTGVSGVFKHRDGRTGLWSWQGPLAEDAAERARPIQ